MSIIHVTPTEPAPPTKMWPYEFNAGWLRESKKYLYFCWVIGEREYWNGIYPIGLYVAVRKDWDPVLYLCTIPNNKKWIKGQKLNKEKFLFLLNQYNVNRDMVAELVLSPQAIKNLNDLFS